MDGWLADLVKPFGKNVGGARLLDWNTCEMTLPGCSKKVGVERQCLGLSDEEKGGGMFSPQSTGSHEARDGLKGG